MAKQFTCKYCGFHTVNESTAKSHCCTANISATYQGSPSYSPDAWQGAFMIDSTCRSGGVFESGGGSFGGGGSSGSWDSGHPCSSSDSGSSSSCDSGGGGGD